MTSKEEVLVIQLKDWENKEEAGTRFPPLSQVCPHCGEKLLEDTWPPNYCSGSGGGHGWESSGSVKAVCTQCKLFFLIYWKESHKHSDDGTLLGYDVVEREQEFVKELPLIERDGYWLTPHDVSREEYRDKHGEYRKEVYA